MEDKLKLSAGDTLVKEGHRSKGPMAETDIWTYSIINSKGEKVGSVEYTDHTSINGFNRTQSVEQRDIDGNIIIDVSW
ncbi:hypothetical protein [Cellvibrio sp. BR]|uniref:hypothetical protein n=1 Tax=Cellvibrio sp. BR TaxID=1134474 RepID=UPI00058C8540|nr:hypothetical protein [Cellvibrio sp. BR]